MVGLVLVSHSRRLAEAASELAKGVSQQELPIAFAGGTGDDHAELGTDATDIMDAIQQVNHGDGVAVLMDLGSAVLSSRMAQEMLDGDVPDIRLCPAPLVEGAVAAAIQIGAGAALDDVVREATTALAAKQHEMVDGDGDTAEPLPAADVIPTEAVRIAFTLDDPHGMHTRPAAEFVKAVAGLDAEVRLRNASAGTPPVDARSLNQIALANIRHSDVAEAAVWGPDAADAAAAIRALIAGPYHGAEATAPDPAAATPEPETADAPRLAALAPGVAIGALHLDADTDAALPALDITDPEAEVARFDAAVGAARAALARQRDGFAAAGHDAAILDAQSLILDDDAILDAVRAAVRSDRRDAASLYQGEMRRLADRYRALDDSYMRERAADVGGVAALVLAALAGRDQTETPGGDVIVCAREVAPAQLGRWAPGQLKGILTYEGGPTSHVAILAKAMGIPAIMGYRPPDNARSGDPVAMDAATLEVAVRPSPAQSADFTARRTVWAEAAERDLADSHGPAVTRDGLRVMVESNVGDTATAEAAVRYGAEGVGLLRTEFLFLDRRLPPDEDEQVQALAAIAGHFGGVPLTVRTLDAGGDKPMPWLRLRHEANPFLGVRGVRLMRRHPDLFKTQIRALLRAGAGRDLRIMVPMISDAAEVAFCREVLETSHAELEREGCDHRWPVRFGIMIETPAAALQAARLAESVDFFSIGTNDLTQYVMCAERGSVELAGLSDGMHPAVLRAIAMTADGAARRGIETAVCGEMAGDPAAALALVGLGIRTLSMNPSAIGPVKRALRHSALADLADRAGQALALDAAADARALFERET